jgi:hypothetical protein
VRFLAIVVRPRHTAKPQFPLVRDLFDASTVLTVGKGDKAMFWHSSWVNRLAPKNIAPSLFLKSKRKNISILKAIENNIWIDTFLPSRHWRNYMIMSSYRRR